METIALKVALALSFLTLVSIFCYTFFIYRKQKQVKKILTPIQVFTVGGFCSILLLFVPLCIIECNNGRIDNYVMAVLLSLYHAVKVFFFDLEYEMIHNSLGEREGVLSVIYGIYTMCLCVVAPALTLTSILSVFKDIGGLWKYKVLCSKKVDYYIMSELNKESLVLAKSICERDKKAQIVFTNVFAKNEEQSYELLVEAQEVHAICLKQDILHIDIFSPKGKVELFLIGEDESENINQASSIVKELNCSNKKHNVKIFVFGYKESGRYVLEALEYDNLLEYANANDYNENTFKLRRINKIKQLVWNTVPKMKVFDVAQKNNNVLSVLIVGLGKYGMEFLKMLTWYFQFEGYKLEVNIIDQMKEETESILKRQCPDLLKTNDSKEDGEAHYDIKIFSGINMMSADFDELLLCEDIASQKKSVSERLKKTNIAIVALGDDDLNIEVSTHLRSLFDRVHKDKIDEEAWEKTPPKFEDEQVHIYAVVYDEQKTDSIEQSFLQNHKQTPYNIHFVGGMSTEYAYNYIYNEDLEKKALFEHEKWVKIVEKKEERKKFEKFEYYRLSSLANVLYSEEIKNNEVLNKETICKNKDLQDCRCENCVRKMKSEHMRWNAYTRTIGYSYDENHRADRAKLHNKLCKWETLSDVEKKKDK